MPDKTNPPAIQISAEQADELCQRLKACVTASEDALITYRENVEEQRALFDPTPARDSDDKPWEGACELHVARCEWMVQQVKARIRHALFDVNPLFKVEPLWDRDREDAAKSEQFLQRLIVDYMQQDDELLRVCEGGLRDGTEVVYLRWRREVKDITTWETVSVPLTDSKGKVVYPESAYSDPSVQWLDEVPHTMAADEQGMPVPQPMQPEMTEERRPNRRPVVTYDGPEYVRVDVTRAGTYPAANSSVSRSSIVYVRYSEDWDSILQRVESGEYDRKAVESLRGLTPGTEHLQTTEDSTREIEATVDASRTRQWEPLDLIEAWVGYVPLADSRHNEIPERQDMATSREFLVTFEPNSDTVLRAVPNPRWDGERPIEPIMPRDARFGIYGYSIPDFVGDIQRAETDMVRRMMDRLDKDLRRPIAVELGLLGAEGREDLAAQNKPAGVIEVMGAKELQYLADPSVPASSAIPVLQWLNDIGQRAGGVPDPKMGMMPAGDRTLGEVQITVGQADMLDQMVIRNCGRSLARIARLTLASAYQCIANDSMQAVWAQANPEEPLLPEIEQAFSQMALMGVPPDQAAAQLGLNQGQLRRLQNPELLPGEAELAKPYKITCWGVAEDASRVQNRQKWLMMGPQVLQDPDVMADPRRYYTAKSDYYTAMGLDPRRYLGTEEEFLSNREKMAQVMQQQAGMQDQEGQRQEGEAQLQREDAEAGRQHERDMAEAARQHERDMADLDRAGKMEMADRSVTAA